MVNLSISGPILKCTLRANIGNIDLTIKNINQVQGRLESDSTFCIFGHLAHICRRFRAIFRTFPFYFQFLWRRFLNDLIFRTIIANKYRNSISEIVFK